MNTSVIEQIYNIMASFHENTGIRSNLLYLGRKQKQDLAKLEVLPIMLPNNGMVLLGHELYFVDSDDHVSCSIKIK